MNNILKQSEAWGIALKQDKFRFATLKLTFFYVLSTAAILFFSSVAILLIFAPPETEIPFAPDAIEMEVEHDDWSAYELREHLSMVIFLVDTLVLLVVASISYSFARRTLSPIKEMQETQAQFMSDTAHELRTPLSVMQIGADTMLRRERSADEYQDFITDVQVEAGRLTRLSNQLLHLLKSDDIELAQSSRINISNLITTEVKRFAAYAKEYGVSLISQVPTDIIIETNADSLIEVLQNLLKNAIDYNRKDGTVTISTESKNDSVKITVQDTGIGIPAKQQEIIFNRFTKVDSARTQNEKSGAGLGLAIVKSLVEKLNGTIHMDSTEYIGTTITISLPVTYS